jgi:hypothetical protein
MVYIPLVETYLYITMKVLFERYLFEAELMVVLALHRALALE